MKKILVFIAVFFIMILLSSSVDAKFLIFGNTDSSSSDGDSRNFFFRWLSYVESLFFNSGSQSSNSQDLDEEPSNSIANNKDNARFYQNDPNRDSNQNDDGSNDLSNTNNGQDDLTNSNNQQTGSQNINNLQLRETDLDYVDLHSRPLKVENLDVLSTDVQRTFQSAIGEEVTVTIRRPRINNNVVNYRQKNQGESDYDYLSGAMSHAKEVAPVKLVIPYGEYTLSLPPEKNVYFYFKSNNQWNCEDFIFDGSGSKLILKETKSFMRIIGCKRIQIKNWFIKYDKRLASVGTVKVDGNGEKYIFVDQPYQLDVKNNPAYQRITTLYQHTYRDDQFGWRHYETARWLGHVNPGEVLNYDPNNDRFIPNNPNILKDFPVDDSLALKHFEYDSSLFSIYEGEDIMINDITAYNVPGMFLYADSMKRGIMVNQNTVKVDPNDHLGFVSASADGINIGSIGGDIDVSNNWIVRNGDDSLNIHGRMYEVVSINGNEIKFRSRWLNRPIVNLEDNERLAFFDTNFKYKGYSNVIEINNFNSNTETFTVTVDEYPTSLSVGDHIHRVDKASRRYFVSDNTFGQNWGRGILVQASSGIVKSNRIFGTTGPGIIGSIDYAYFEAAGPIVNVIFRNNNISHSGTSELISIGKRSTNTGSFSLSASLLPIDGYYIEQPIHQMVRIINNRISTAPGVSIHVSSGKDIFVGNNKIIDGNRFPFSRFNTGANTGREADGAIYLSDSENLRLYGNQMTDSGGIFKGPNVENCNGC